MFVKTQGMYTPRRSLRINEGLRVIMVGHADTPVHDAQTTRNIETHSPNSAANLDIH